MNLSFSPIFLIFSLEISYNFLSHDESLMIMFGALLRLYMAPISVLN